MKTHGVTDPMDRTAFAENLKNYHLQDQPLEIISREIGLGKIAAWNQDQSRNTVMIQMHDAASWKCPEPLRLLRSELLPKMIKSRLHFR